VNYKAPALFAKWMPWLQAGVIATAVFAIYGSILRGDWLWDDNLDITENRITHSPTGLWRIWFEPGSQTDYYPIKASVQWVQWHLWGMDTFDYHLTNVLLHLIGSLLVWRLLHKLGLKFAWLGGLLFAVHPVQVESVAWIAELKNTLSLPLFLLSMCAWIDYEKQGRRRDYRLALGFFLIAMLCKTTMVMFPLVILLYAWWKRGQIHQSDIKSSLPFFALSLLLGLITLTLLKTPALTLHEIALGGFFSRLACVGQTFSVYFFHAMAPGHLMPLYSKWPVEHPSLIQFLPWIGWGGLFYLCWKKRKTWGRHALLGLGFFLITLLPFLGLVAVSYMRFSWVMDHFLYLPIIGLIGLVVAGMEWIQTHLRPRSYLFGIGVVTMAILFLTWESFLYAEMWANSKSLWTYTLERFPDSWEAHDNLGNTWLREERWPEAILEFRKGVELKPDYDDARNELSFGLAASGQVPEAIAEYQGTLKIDPQDTTALNNLGVIYWQTKQSDLAESCDEQALQVDPRDASLHNNLGLVFIQKNLMEQAIDQYEQALQLDPDYTEAHNNLGDALVRINQIPEARAQYEETLNLDPNNSYALTQLGHLQDIQIKLPDSK
jgi:Flp pilus assembly protein TadD